MQVQADMLKRAILTLAECCLSCSLQSHHYYHAWTLFSDIDLVIAPITHTADVIIIPNTLVLDIYSECGSLYMNQYYCKDYIYYLQ